MESLVPIVRTDNDIESILSRADQSINGIIDLFIKAGTIGVHVMRAIEPNLRFGAAIRNHLNRTERIPHCEYRNTMLYRKCVRLASKKQIGDVIIKYQDSIIS